MTFSFDCPNCGRTLKAPEGAAGKTAECKFCHSKLTIPVVVENTSGGKADQLAFDMISSTARTRRKDPRVTLVVESPNSEYLRMRSQYSPLLQRAIWGYECRLHDDAQRVLIEFLVQPKVDFLEKSAAMYLLGLICFEGGKTQNAVKIWTTLMEECPDSFEAKLVEDRLDELRQGGSGVADEYIDELRANMYLKNGDSWISERKPGFYVDPSYINNIEAAVHWYDKTIMEFPDSLAGRLAHEAKLKALIGWKDKEDFGLAYGAMGEFSEYLPRVLEAYESFEKSFPEAPSLQPIRYQIAQLYWMNKDFINTEVWLKKVIDHGSGDDSYYVDLANRRLNKLSASI
jgi:hypothetical protein